MKNLFKKICIALVALGIGLGGASIASATLKVVQTPTYHLYTGESGTATSMRITPYPIDLDGVKLTMSDFGDTPTVTVDPKLTGIEEIESFTGITDNGDNTATLSGVSRDLQSKSPYTGTGTGRTHGSGATVVFGNNPQIYGRLASWENAGTITALWTFTTSPIVPTPSTPTQAANKAYVDGVAIAGAPNATTVVQGLVQIGTAAQIASSTATGSTGAALAIPTSMATSSNDVAGLHVVVTQNSGKINWNQIDLGTAFTATALGTFTSGILSTASSTLNATTSIAASSVTNKALILNGISYAFPSTQSASGTALETNGSGVLSWETTPAQRIVVASTTSMTISNGSATSSLFAIPAGFITASSTIELRGNFTCTSSSGSNSTCGIFVQDSNGHIYAGTNGNISTSQNSNSVNGGYHALIIMNNSASSEIGIDDCAMSGVGGTNTTAGWSACGSSVSSAINFAAGISLGFGIKGNGSNQTALLSNFSIIITQ